MPVCDLYNSLALTSSAAEHAKASYHSSIIEVFRRSSFTEHWQKGTSIFLFLKSG